MVKLTLLCTYIASFITIASASSAFIQITGVKQGNFVATDLPSNRIQINNFEFNVTRPIDVATGQPSGITRSGQVYVERDMISNASIQILIAAVENELLSTVTISVFSANSRNPAAATLQQTIRLTNCFVTAYDENFKGDLVGENFLISYQKILVTIGTFTIQNDNTPVAAA